jgi:hypothetical protein
MRKQSETDSVYPFVWVISKCPNYVFYWVKLKKMLFEQCMCSARVGQKKYEFTFGLRKSHDLSVRYLIGKIHQNHHPLLCSFLRSTILEN